MAEADQAASSPEVPEIQSRQLPRPAAPSSAHRIAPQPKAPESPQTDQPTRGSLEQHNATIVSRVSAPSSRCRSSRLKPSSQPTNAQQSQQPPNRSEDPQENQMGSDWIGVESCSFVSLSIGKPTPPSKPDWCSTHAFFIQPSVSSPATPHLSEPSQQISQCQRNPHRRSDRVDAQKARKPH